MAEFEAVVIDVDDGEWQTAMRWAAAFLAGFRSAQTRRSYGRDSPVLEEIADRAVELVRQPQPVVHLDILRQQHQAEVGGERADLGGCLDPLPRRSSAAPASP